MTETNQVIDKAEARQSGEMSIVGHLEELRRRMIISCAVVLLASGACYFYAAELVHLITAPAGKLYYLNPAEAFFTYLKVSFFSGLLLSLPVIFYELWAFVVPALTKEEHRIGMVLVPSSLLLFFMGLAFSYFFVLPAGIKFFMGFATEDLQPMFSIGQYASFVISFLLPFGLVFELPLIILMLAKFGVVTSEYLVSKRRMVIVLSFVVGAIISPTPDVFSQTMIAIPLLILYQVSIWVVKHILSK